MNNDGARPSAAAVKPTRERIAPHRNVSGSESAYLACDLCERVTIHRLLLTSGQPRGVCTGCAMSREWSEAAAASFDLETYRREKMARLERENEFLRGERARLETLLAEALRVATGGTGNPLDLLDALADYVGTNLARPAFVEARQREVRAT
jgi:hypothetical protein